MATVPNEDGRLPQAFARYENTRQTDQTPVAVGTWRIRALAIYDYELQRIWPVNEENRKAKIEQFAKQQGFHLSYYKQGFCTIFEGALPSRE